MEEVEILIRKAESKLNTAKILFEEEIYEDAISFGLEFVKNGEIGEEYASMISTVEERRERADYDVYYDPTRYEAEKIIADAKRFLERIEEAIKGE